ncbi:MAG: peptidylprolyl isomerase [Ignavibacteriaceae bacterium]
MKRYFSFAVLMLFIIGCGYTNSDDTNKESKKMTDNTKHDSTLVAVIKTNMGNIELELFADKTPKTVENFTGLAEKGYYNGVIFHRIIDNFMIQGGDPTGTGRGGESLWGGKFEDEIDSSLTFDEPGCLAMANAGPNTNGSQFFITTVPTPWLNGHHTIFGKVVGGMDVVNSISKVETTKPYDRPVKDVVMKEVIIEKKVLRDNNPGS